MNILTIDKNEFQKGVTLDNNDEAGGLGPDSIINHFKSKGFTLIPSPNLTDVATKPSNKIIDSCIDPTYLGDECFLVDFSGNFYILDGVTLTLKQTDSTNNFIYGTTRIITFKGEIFCTSSQNITKLPADMSSIDKTWWTVTQGKSSLNSSYRHILAISEDTLYIADKNMIHTWDGTTAVYNAMSFPTSYNITEMILSTDGRSLLVFASETANASHYKKTKARIFVVDTVTLEFTQEIPVADQTETAINIGGTIYVVYGKSFGYFTGSGYKLIKKLNISEVLYAPRVTTIDNAILIAEDENILVYGDVNGKGNIFFNVARSAFPYNNLQNILAFGNIGVDDNKVLINYYNNDELWQLKIIDLDNIGGNAGIAYTKRYNKGRVWVRRIEIETETLQSDDILYISILNSDGTYSDLGTYSYAINGAVEEVRIDCNNLVDRIQLKFAWNRFEIKSIKIYYESGE